MPQETLVVITYKSLDHEKLNDQSKKILATIRDPFDNILSTQALEKDGKLAFSSEHAGDHRVCFGINNPDSRSNLQYKVEIHVDSGEHAHDYDKLARVEHLSSFVNCLKFCHPCTFSRAARITQQNTCNNNT